MDNKNNCDDMTPLISKRLLLKNIMDQSIDSLYFKDNDFRFITVNKNKAARHGIKNPSEMYGKTDYDYISQGDANRIFEDEKSILETGQPIIGKIEKITRIDGSTTWESSSKYPLYDDAGKNIGIWGISRDITEQELAKEALREREERYSQLSEFNRSLTWEVDDQGLLTYIDHMSKAIVGYYPDELVYKKHFFDLLPENESEAVKQTVFNIFMHKGLIQNLEIKSQAKDGHAVWFSINGIPMLKKDGTLQGYRGSNTDITERKNVEEALGKSEERFRATFEQAAVGIVHATFDGKFTRVNQKFCDIVGYPQNELLNMSFEDITHHNYLQDDMDNIRKLLNGDIQTFSMEKRYFRKDNTIVWVNLTVSVINQPSGEFAYVMGVVEDISERKRLEAALSNEKKLLETTLISVGDGVISTDNKGNIVFLNRVAEFLTGWTQEAAMGKWIEEVFYIVDEFTRKKGDNIVKKVIESGKILMLANHTLLISKNGIERPIEDSAAPIIQENGENVGVVLVFRDVSEKKKKLDEIEFLSFHDQLTGLYNRRFYEEELKRLDTKRNFPMAIAMGDVNGLKLINDSFGHAMGDELLKKTAELIKRGCRADDIVARLGGDEFIILLPKTDAEGAESVIKRINELSLNEKVDNIDISISFGYGIKISKEESTQDIYKTAEKQMYRNKLSESSMMKNTTIDMILNALYQKCNGEQLHSVKVSEICEAIATKLDFDMDGVYQIRIAGLMHDIGKIEIDGSILNKPLSLDEDEWGEIKRHPEIGYRILSSVKRFSKIAEYVLEHHERWDGKGYPRGLKGDKISLQARIIALADSYDTMTTNRVYDKALSEEDAIGEIKRYSGTQFDPAIAKLFVTMILGKVW